MKQTIQHKTIIASERNSVKRLSRRRGFILILLALTCFGLLPTPNAFGVSPAPDGGYPGGNTAEGQNALFSLTSGIYNTANGFDALYHNTTGLENTATGSHALLLNTTGGGNTANGMDALFSNTAGGGNTADDDRALADNTTGSDNTANGFQALLFNTAGTYNTAVGVYALFANRTGINNTAIGFDALFSNTTGGSDIALGFRAGYDLTTGSNNIDIGNVGVGGESDKIRIGTVGTQTATFIAGIHGVPVTGTAVVVSSSGQLGVAPSSARFKDEIKPMDKASEAILALQPVIFRYKHELDPDGIPQFGLVAEQVEKVNPHLVARDGQGKVYTVRYDAVNAMLLNEFLKEHRTVQELKSAAAKQEATVVWLTQDFQSKLAEQQKQIKALTSGLEKINNQLELNKPAPQMVAKNQ